MDGKIDEQLQHLEEVVAWFVYYLIELGPQWMYPHFDEVLNRELLDRIDEGTMTNEELQAFILASERPYSR